MFSYNLNLAIKSLKDRVSLTILTIFTIAIGLGLYTTVKTMSYQNAKMPLPHKSDNIFLVQMDNRELTADPVDHQADLVDTTYKDSINLLSFNLEGVQQTMNWSTYGILNVEEENIAPIRTFGAVTTHNFFTMFETPMLFGSGWDKQSEDKSEGVIVISKLMNDQLFGGINSVGQSIRINTLNLRVIGVMDEWFLPARFYDRSYSGARPDNYFIPYTFAMNNNLPRRARFDCWQANANNSGRFRENDKEELLTSECAWITYWAEIADGKVDAYKAQIENYMAEQRSFGRFPREPLYYVTSLTEQIFSASSRNQFIQMFSVLSILFFSVCLLNAIGILLAKFMRRTREVSLRRALGAKKNTIIIQHIIEVVIIGLIGGVFGIVFSYFGLKGMLNIALYASDYTLQYKDLLPFYQLDLTMVFHAFVTSIICTLLVSIYPIWRLCNIAPASQLKSQ